LDAFSLTRLRQSYDGLVTADRSRDRAEGAVPSA